MFPASAIRPVDKIGKATGASEFNAMVVPIHSGKVDFKETAALNERTIGRSVIVLRRVVRGKDSPWEVLGFVCCVGLGTAVD